MIVVALVSRSWASGIFPEERSKDVGIELLAVGGGAAHRDAGELARLLVDGELRVIVVVQEQQVPLHARVSNGMDEFDVLNVRGHVKARNGEELEPLL